MSDETPPVGNGVILSIEVLDDLSVVANSEGLSGSKLLQAAAAAIAGSVRVVEKVWLAAGYDAKDSQRMGQCAINIAGQMLAKDDDIVSGRIETRTKNGDER